MSEEEYIEYRAECAREEARYDLQNPHFVKPYNWVLERTLFNEMTEEDFIRIRKEMGEQL